MDMVKRHYAAAKVDGKRQEEEAPAARNTQEDEEPIPAIQVNRWQDLQKQLGKGPGSNSNDYTIPAVLRYSRNKAEEK
jgi:cell division protein FtsZ